MTKREIPDPEILSFDKLRTGWLQNDSGGNGWITVKSQTIIEYWEEIMRQGCISLGGIKCDSCGRVIAHSERYLAIDEEKGVEVEKGQIMRYCVQCTIDKGYAHYKEEKDGRVLTFFP